MYSLFSKALSSAPDAIAFILTNKEHITYHQAELRVQRWVNYLLSKGISQGDRVGLLTQYEDLHPFVHLAVDKINATMVPLDTETPHGQLQLDLTTLALKILLIDNDLCQHYTLAENIKQPLATSEMMFPEAPQQPANEPLVIIRDPAIPNYIVASSGVSGNKKWIPIGSAGLEYWAKIERSLLKLGNKDKILCTRSPAYDARISEYVRAFATASGLILISQTDRRDFNAILKHCEHERVSCIILIASQLMGLNQDEVISRLAKAGLAHLMVTGDACTAALKKLCETHGINLWNCYGPTEATFGMSILCVNNIALQDEQGQDLVPIARPHSDEVNYHLIDECLYIESPYLSAGYLQDSERTLKNFPLMPIGGRQIRVFNTENRFVENGNYLIFKGRIDENAHCKVSGVKVEPYAIEQCLQQYNLEAGFDALQAYVVIKPWLNQNRPFAYLVVKQDFSKPLFAAFLKKWLKKEEMPILIALKAFPRLIPSEKIDRRALIERVDHPDEFFFNEGYQSNQKFSAGGKGVSDETRLALTSIASHIENGTEVIADPVKVIEQVDALVLAANNLDQSVDVTEQDKNLVVRWLKAAYTLFTSHFPEALTLDESKQADAPIRWLSSLALLSFTLAKAHRYQLFDPEYRLKLFQQSLLIANYLECNSSSEDEHGFKGRLLTYNTGLMYCYKAQGDFVSALKVVKEQILSALEKDEIFHVILYKAHAAEILLAMNQIDEAMDYAKDSLLLARQFYNGSRPIFYNALLACLQCHQKKNENEAATAFALEILANHQRDALCGAKPYHVEAAKKTLTHSKLMQRLTEIWADVLGLETANYEQDFIFMGGDSFKLNHLLQKIQQELSKEYTYRELISLPSITLIQIAHSLDAKLTSEPVSALIKPLVLPNKHKLNYFFLPPLLGEGYFTYRQLAVTFSSRFDANVYGLSDPAIEDSALLPQSLEMAANHYVRAIRKIQPQGPYYLLGYSYGGLHAYQVAKALIAEGEQIKDLQIVDGFPPALYQSLPAKAHAELLEELINFVIQTLNNRHYDEGLKAIKLTKFETFSPQCQITTAFDFLTARVKKPHSQALLALARQHLLFMLQASEGDKLDIKATLYLSTPNQTYLDIIFRIQKIVQRSADCQYYFWNHYFERMVLDGKRAEASHLDLLRHEIWAHRFWERSQDTVFLLQDEIYTLNSYYHERQVNEGESQFQIYSLNKVQSRCYQALLAKWPQVSNLCLSPLYEKIHEKYERKSRIYGATYSLSFRVSNEQSKDLHTLFSSKKLMHYTGSAPARDTKHTINDKFLINLDIYWNRRFLMSLNFHCHSDYRALLNELFQQMGMHLDNFSAPEKNAYNLSHGFLDIQNPSIFNALEKISSWLNQFILLLMPHVEVPETRRPAGLSNK